MKKILLIALGVTVFVSCGHKSTMPEATDTPYNDTIAGTVEETKDSWNRTNCVVEDLVIPQDEFLVVQAEMSRYNYAERERGIIPEDTDLVLSESNNSSLTFEELMEDVWLGEWPEAGKRNVVISAGDACWTIIHGDTVVVETCGLMLSRNNELAGIWKEWGAGDDELPAYIYFHRIGDSSLQIYGTTPAWTPTGRENTLFWGPDGWLYIEGIIPNTDHFVWHKIKVIR